MKVLVVSDSHGNVENVCRAIDLVQPRMLLHLGDGWRDAQEAARRYPDLPIEKVPGNCDFRRDEMAERLIVICGRLFLLCHGHTLGVKSSYNELLRAALEHKADAVLFGHTHIPFTDFRRGVMLLNPGSVGDFQKPTYAVLTFTGGAFVPATYVLPPAG